MTRIPKALLLTALAAAIPSALAQMAAPTTSGYVGIGGLYTSNTSGLNPFKLEEYRDLSDGVTGTVDLRMDAQDWWSRLFGENIARDDQFIELKGGKYGVFKYSLYNDKIVHNLTFNAITPFTGVGTDHLTFAGNAPPSTEHRDLEPLPSTACSTTTRAAPSRRRSPRSRRSTSASTPTARTARE
jgi:hypothetical protein